MPFFVQIESNKNIQGDATNANFEGQIVGETYLATAGRGVKIMAEQRQGLGVVQHQPISFSKRVDCSSPLLWECLCSPNRESQTFKTVTFSFTDSGGTNLEYTVALGNARIVQMTMQYEQSGGANTLPTEMVSLAYESIYFKHEPSGEERRHAIGGAK